MPYKNRLVQQEYQREWMAHRRDEFFKDKQCICCGGNKNLELSHRDRETKVSHKIWSWSKIRRDSELVKCDVMCNSCHKIKTAEEKEVNMRHGTYNLVYNLGCRCVECRRYIRVRSQLKMARRRESNKRI